MQSKFQAQISKIYNFSRIFGMYRVVQKKNATLVFPIALIGHKILWEIFCGNFGRLSNEGKVEYFGQNGRV